MVAPFSREHAAGATQIAFQLMLGLGAMLAVAGLGGGGEATLLVPLSPAARAALPALALDGRTSLLGAGLLPGSLVVRRGDGPHRTLLATGVVALAVPASLCRGGA